MVWPRCTRYAQDAEERRTPLFTGDAGPRDPRDTLVTNAQHRPATARGCRRNESYANLGPPSKTHENKTIGRHSPHRSNNLSENDSKTIRKQENTVKNTTRNPSILFSATARFRDFPDSARKTWSPPTKYKKCHQTAPPWRPTLFELSTLGLRSDGGSL